MGCGQCDQQYFGIWRDIFGSLESVLERLPTAKVMRKDQEGAVIEAEVYGRGVLMWLLTQGSMVEVLGPSEAREEMKQMLSEMLSKYIV